jgi:hypothetical protein
MSTETIMVILFVWNLVGFFITLIWNVLVETDGWELYNPYLSYDYHTSVNWFGAIIISLFYTALFPVGAICYWFYKLCTVGRRDD